MKQYSGIILSSSVRPAAPGEGEVKGVDVKLQELHRGEAGTEGQSVGTRGLDWVPLGAEPVLSPAVCTWGDMFVILTLPQTGLCYLPPAE